MTDQTERDAIRLLDPVRDMEPGPSSVDVHRAIRDGRRRVRNRRLAGVAVAVVFLAAMASVGGALKPDPQADAGGPGPAEFGALEMAFTVGSAAGYTPLTYETGKYWQAVELVKASQPDERALASVRMFPARPLYLHGATKPWEPGDDRAPNVNGHPAYWKPPNPYLTDGNQAATSAQLAWEWAGGAWAFVTIWDYTHDTEGEVRARAHRVAESVAPAVDDVGVRVPFTVARSAVDVDQLDGAIVSYGATGRADGRLLAGLIFGDSYLNGGRLFVGVSQDLNREPLNSSQLRGALPDSAATVQLAAGFSAVAEGVGEEAPDLWTKQQLTALAEAVRLVDDPTNPDSWVSDSLR